MLPMCRIQLRAALVAIGMCLASVSAASATTNVVDTRDDTVVTFISAFGVPNTTTYGQTIIAPAGAQTLTSFTFRLENLPFTVFTRAEVYAWDGTKATGAELFGSSLRTTTGTTLQDLTFDTGGTPVTAGSQYVLFLSAAKEFESSVGGSGRFRSRTNATYPDGQFVFLNNGTDESQWTVGLWSTIASDLQFRARFTSTTQALSVSKTGNGSGTVSSSPNGINCGADCSEDLGDGTLVALQATARAGSTFAGFSGSDCLTNPCLVTMDDAKSVGAQFTDGTAPETTITKRRGKRISFTSSESNSTFMCKLDKGKTSACTSPYKLKRVRRGRHVFTVTATDAAGNADSTPAKSRFAIK